MIGYSVFFDRSHCGRSVAGRIGQSVIGRSDGQCVGRVDGRAASPSDTVADSGAFSSVIVFFPLAFAAVARPPRAPRHLAVYSAVATSAGIPASAVAPISFQIYRSRAVFSGSGFRTECSARLFNSW